jgi:Planctomycete cytochrome C
MPPDGHSNVVAGLLACALGLSACSTPPDSGPPCVTLNTQCQPLHDPPTYSTIFSKIFQPSCAIGMGNCHTSDAPKLGLYFEDPAQAYQLLLGKTDGRARVLPDDPGCSILAKRILSKDPAFRMPPGNVPLLDGEICDIVKWLADGAKDN